MDSTSFTFLATVLVLVLLSASLVLRSYILRRRYRLRFQQALADGLIVDVDRSAFNDAGQFDPFGGFRRSTRRLGPKPVLWGTRIHPADKYDSWSSITPVAVCCKSELSPSRLMSSPQPGFLPSPQAQSRPSLFSRLRRSNFPSSLLPSQPPAPAASPAVPHVRSPPPQPESADLSICTEKDAATLSVCVLVAMPDVSAPVNRPVPAAKGKGVHPLESQAHQQSGNADPLLLLPPQRSGSRIPDFEGLPLLEFGVVEVRTGEWVWRT